MTGRFFFASKCFTAFRKHFVPPFHKKKLEDWETPWDQNPSMRLADGDRDTTSFSKYLDHWDCQKAAKIPACSQSWLCQGDQFVSESVRSFILICFSFH
jgi:hypothetical protein